MNNINIKEIRKKLGLTQQEFAEKLGIHYKTIQNWEAGKPIPDSKKILLSKILNENTSQNQTINNNVSNNSSEIELLKQIITLMKENKELMKENKELIVQNKELEMKLKEKIIAQEDTNAKCADVA